MTITITATIFFLLLPRLLQFGVQATTVTLHPRVLRVEVLLNNTAISILVDGHVVERVEASDEGADGGGGVVLVAALHQTRGDLMASRTLPTSKPGEALVLRHTLNSFQPGRLLVLALKGSGALYLSRAEPCLRAHGFSLVGRVGVGESWVGVTDGRETWEAVVTRPPPPSPILSYHTLTGSPSLPLTLTLQYQTKTGMRASQNCVDVTVHSHLTRSGLML
ncbi:hypothetical protein Pcinc_022673 [Petrolisthes cinctipes]|uniref:Uncharacterized protein n=1 Tax=Petrolisthes cinctipes TaxID=88211 RepID=A0AAE1FDT0_PETCI|nr:hypothetical protein Pcinc_022673 [Petrolisthes cinctipes]